MAMDPKSLHVSIEGSTAVVGSNSYSGTNEQCCSLVSETTESNNPTEESKTKSDATTDATRFDGMPCPTHSSSFNGAIPSAAKPDTNEAYQECTTECSSSTEDHLRYLQDIRADAKMSRIGEQDRQSEAHIAQGSADTELKYDVSSNQSAESLALVSLENQTDSKVFSLPLVYYSPSSCSSETDAAATGVIIDAYWSSTSTSGTDVGKGSCKSPGSVSSSESICRICHMGSNETGESIQNCECVCRGGMSKAHRSCLIEWVLYNGSNQCEICRTEFENVSPPPVAMNSDHRQIMQALAWELAQARPFSRKKRIMLASTIIILVLITSVISILTVSMERELRHYSSSSWSTYPVNKLSLLLTICAGIMFFCVTLTIGLVGLWALVELWFYMNRRRIVRRASRRFVGATGI